MTLAAQLINTKNTRIVLGFARRLPNSEGFAVELEDISDLCMAQSGNDDDAEVLAAKVQAINTSVERLVRSAPEQYQWEYRRFKHTLK
jgi:KDO2-lipid IV(A) lauroyltransferase